MSEILTFLQTIWQTGEVREIRAFDQNGQVWYGYFDTPEKAAQAAQKLSATHTIYVTLNPCKPALLARCANKIKRAGKKDPTTGDKDIAELRLLLIDLDPDRPTGISASEEEKSIALETARAIANELGNPLLVGDSGNGTHLIYQHNAKHPDALKTFLLNIATSHNTTIKIDTAVFNPARITKVLGTWARKGDNTPDRPHRQSKILKIYDTPTILDIPAVTQATKALPQHPTDHDGGKFDVRRFLADHNVLIGKEKPGSGGTTLLIFQDGCPFDPSHVEGEAAVVLHPSGMASFQCFHNSCKGRTWADLRERIGAPKTTVTPNCKYCGQKIVWTTVDGHWRPENADGSVHVCLVKSRAKEDAENQHQDNSPEKAYAAQPALTEAKLKSNPVPPFPLDVLPPGIANYCKETAYAISCPIDFPAIASIACMCPLVGESILVIQEGWEEPANQYVAIICDTGTGKTPAIKAIKRVSIDRIEEAYEAQNAQMEKEYAEALLNYELELSAWKATKKQNPQNPIPPPEKPQTPAYKEIFTSNATTEALAEMMAANPGGIILNKDELSAWMHSLDQYKHGEKGEDREFFLSTHSFERAKYNRKGKKPISVPLPRLTVLGGIVPANLKLLAGKIEDGFFERVLCIYPQKVERKFKKNPVKEEIINNAIAAFEACRVTRRIHLTEDAENLWGTFYEMAYSGEYASYKPKLVTMTARIALVLTIAWEQDECNAMIMSKAIRLSEYIEAHINYVIAAANTSEEMHATDAVVAWAKRKGLSLVKVRDLCRVHLLGCESAAKAKVKLQELVDLGLAVVEVENKLWKIL